eukprot:c26363_g1_i1 orf=215-1321(+)
MNSARLLLQSPIEGICGRFHGDSSLLRLDRWHLVSGRLTSAHVKSACAVSLDKFIRRHSVTSDKMDVKNFLNSNVNGTSSALASAEVLEQPHGERYAPDSVGETTQELESVSVIGLQSNINGKPLASVPTDFFEQHQAELCAAGANCVTADELGSVAALSDWLKDRLPTQNSQIEQWGILPGTKTMTNLWVELLQQEISLEDSRPPKRTVHVACVKIKNESGKLLVEAHQEMTDGSIRERNRPLSEKMKPGENVEDACRRGIYEELGARLGAQERVTILQDSYEREVQERESLSYPGLMTCYILHTMEAIVKLLPENDFITQEDETSHHNGAIMSSPSVNMFGDGQSSSTEITIGVKKHFWKWVIDYS